MKLILLGLCAFFLGLSLAEAAPRCLPAKSCKSKQQCIDEVSGLWKCVGVLPKKQKPAGGDTSSGRDRGLTERDREALDRAAGRSSLQDCARRTCSEREIEDAWNRANTGRSSAGRGGRRGSDYYRPGRDGLSQADRDALDEAAARSARDDAEARARRARNENP